MTRPRLSAPDRFIQKSGIVTAMVGLLQAPPGTAAPTAHQREGRMIGDTTGNNVDGYYSTSSRDVPRRCARATKSLLGIHLFTPVRITNGSPDVPARIPATQGLHLVELAVSHGVCPCEPLPVSASWVANVSTTGACFSGRSSAAPPICPWPSLSRSMATISAKSAGRAGAKWSRHPASIPSAVWRAANRIGSLTLQRHLEVSTTDFTDFTDGPQSTIVLSVQSVQSVVSSSKCRCSAKTEVQGWPAKWMQRPQGGAAPPPLKKNEADSGGRVSRNEQGWWCHLTGPASTPPELPWPLPP